MSKISRYAYLAGLIAVLLLAAAIAGLLILTWRRRQQPRAWLPLLLFFAGGVVMDRFMIALDDLYQYWDWVKAPHFSIVTASRHIPEEVGSNAFLGGSCAYVLALENNLRAKSYFTTLYSGVPPPPLIPKLPTWFLMPTAF